MQPFYQSVVRQLQVQGEQCPIFFLDAVDLRFQALDAPLRQGEGQKVGVIQPQYIAFLHTLFPPFFLIISAPAHLRKGKRDTNSLTPQVGHLSLAGSLFLA